MSFVTAAGGDQPSVPTPIPELPPYDEEELDLLFGRLADGDPPAEPPTTSAMT